MQRRSGNDNSAILCAQTCVSVFKGGPLPRGSGLEDYSGFPSPNFE